MHKLNELRDMLMEELEKCSSKGELSAGSLEVIDKLAHAIKSIDTIMAMEDAGYSNDEGYSMARGRGRYAKRDSMGRYSSRGAYNGSYDDNMAYEDRGRRSYGYGRGYSRDEAKEHLAKELRELAMDTTDEGSKQMIHKWIKQVEAD